MFEQLDKLTVAAAMEEFDHQGALGFKVVL
jgi:hypothetical protein